MKQSNNITPIFIIGASRNGTTSLVNMINKFPEVAGIEHELHHGSHEAKLYGFYKYYGDFTNIDKYIDFLYHYSTEDYFQLARGNVDYHLQNKTSDFFQFFFDLSDRYCMSEKKQFWVAKIDPAFFTDKKAFNYFHKLIRTRYPDVKYIRIQREFWSALQSFLYMEGKSYQKRRKWPFRYLYILIYAQSWFKTYLLKNGVIETEGVLHIDFEDFIEKENTTAEMIRGYLGLSAKYEFNNRVKTYPVNTSFSKHNREKEKRIERYLAKRYLRLLKMFPRLVFVFHSFSFLLFWKKDKNPMHRKLIKYTYFKNYLIKEFEDQGANGLLNSLNREIRSKT